jgi:hypothetical protein
MFFLQGKIFSARKKFIVQKILFVFPDAVLGEEERRIVRCTFITGNFLFHWNAQSSSANGGFRTFRVTVAASKGRHCRAVQRGEFELRRKPFALEGQGPASALSASKNGLTAEERANAAICPTTSTVYHIWNKHQLGEYGGRSNDEIFALLDVKIPELAADGIEVRYCR